MIQQILLCAVGWAFQTVLAAAVVLGVSYLGRGKVDYEPWEATVFVVPYAVWFGLVLSAPRYPKAVDNLLVEPCLLAACIGVAAVVRVGLATRVRQDRLAFTLYLAVIAAAVALWRYVPQLSA